MLVQAAGVLTATANFISNDTVIVAGELYKFEATPTALGDVDVGSDLATSLINLRGAINGDFAVGEAFAGTLPAPGVSAVVTATTLTLTVDVPGDIGNGIDFREGVDGGAVFSISTAMAGGVGDLGLELNAIVSVEQLNAAVLQRIGDLSPAAD